MLLSDRVLMMETLLEVDSKDRRKVPFILNPIQKDIILTSGRSDVYVKPAQIGASTVIIADFLLDCITFPSTTAVIISYDKFNTGRLLRKAHLLYAALKRKVPSIPSLDHASTQEMTFPEVNSSFFIASAGSFEFGRGEPIHCLLLDEFGFWTIGSSDKAFMSAIQRVPLIVGTKIRICSTANGEDNDFYEIYKAAKEGTSLGKSVFTPHFYPWFMHPEYSMPPDSPFCLPEDDKEVLQLQSDEEVLVRLHNLTYDQIRWRRFKKAEAASLRRSGDSVMAFEQEFPEDDESCFLIAGDMAYDHELINDKIKNCYPAPTEFEVTNDENGHWARVEVWEEVKQGYGYLMSIDPGKGKTSEAVGHIWRFEDGWRDASGYEHPERMIHCATLAGWHDEFDMAQFCMKLGFIYNTAVNAPEDNLDLVSHMRNYPEWYLREELELGISVLKRGWYTSGKTKPYMITELRRHVAHIECFDKRFWDQCKNVRIDRNSRAGFKIVGSDDHHDAGAIGIVCRSAIPVARGCVGQAGWSDNWGR